MLKKDSNRLSLIVIPIILISLSVGCIQRVEREAKIDLREYCPLNIDDVRKYDNFLGRALVTRMVGNLVTVTHYDSAGAILFWSDYIVKPEGIYQKNIIKDEAHLNSHFEPAVPYSPWSDIVGDTLFVNAVEIRGDSVNSHLRIQLACEIFSRDSVAVPAGTFYDCLEIQFERTTLDDTYLPNGDGVIHMWFARGVGLVKYVSTEHTAALISATIDGVDYPK